MIGQSLILLTIANISPAIILYHYLKTLASEERK